MLIAQGYYNIFVVSLVVVIIIILTHIIMYVFYFSLEIHGGPPVDPHLTKHGKPSKFTFTHNFISSFTCIFTQFIS